LPEGRDSKTPSCAHILDTFNRSIQAAELGLVGAEQVARLDKERTHKGKTKPTQS
jgi:2-polyprenyl-3-methyl-5-hydroxy-6-metoxy-1,4-benzoquinol methylase